MSSSPLASIVIVAWGKRPVTERCLDVLEETLGDDLGTRFELVLVDNDSPDDTAELFAAWEDRATVVYLPENSNFSGGCNAGARVASGEALIFLNNDTEVTPGVIEALAEQVTEPGVGAAGVRLLYPDGSIQHGGVVWREYRLTLPYHLFHHSPGDLPMAGGVFDLDCVTGACLAMPRELFFDLGGFDETYVNGLEDVDLCIKTRVAGHRIVYRGDLAVVHHESLSRGASHSEEENLKVLYPRWGHLFGDDGETLNDLFGADWHPNPRRIEYSRFATDGSRVSLEGEISSLAPDAAESRALLGLLEEGGVAPAARDRQPNIYSPRLDPDEWRLMDDALRRLTQPAPLTIRVPAGDLERPPDHEPSVLRLATLAPRRADGAVAVWAATPALADALMRDGIPADHVEVLAPIVSASRPGPGGEGILALLPLQDRAACVRVLDGLAPLASEQRVRVLPNVGGLATERLVGEHLPSAELLAPVTNERDFAALAGTCDAVLCLDPSDRFDRRALIAAGAGAPVVSLGGRSAAHWLPDAVDVPSEADAQAIAAALSAALERSADREARGAAVRSACFPNGLAHRIVELVTQAEHRAGRIGGVHRSAA